MWNRPVIPSCPTTANKLSARVSASGANSSATAQNFYGSPVDVSAPVPNFDSDLVMASFTPLSCSGSVQYDGTPPNGLSYGGSVQVGLCVYANGSRILFSSGFDYLVLSQASIYGRFLPYGYYGGRYNAAMDGSDLVRGDPSYAFASGKPDQVGLMVRVARGSFSFDGRIMLVW